MSNNKYKDYLKQTQKIADIDSSISLLHWDMETKMPEGGAKFRGQQLATLTGISHQLSTNDEYGDLLKTLSSDDSLDGDGKANIRESLKQYTRKSKLPESFVEESSLLFSEGFVTWQKAHHASDFTMYQDTLEKIVDIKRKEADLVGYEGHAYNGLLEEYEPDTTVDDLDTIFTEVKSKLVPFLKNISNQKAPQRDFLETKFRADKQWRFGLDLLKGMGFDFKHGRQDKSLHPFSTNFSPEDVRVTTCINENDVMNMVGSCIHEGGHALYEQGLRVSQYGLPCGTSNSYGIHESMSRFWENNIGLSKSYWQYNFGYMKDLFNDELEGIEFNEFYKAINTVKPGLVRTQADEITYHFHVMVRYEIEKKLMEGNIKVSELPEFWNNHYKEYLGVEVPSDKQGVLQDVHWSGGAIGYFPTYSLGSFYAAQFHHAIQKEFSDFDSRVEKGELGFIKEWLSQNVYRYGRKFSPKEICQKISGEELKFDYFMNYANEKYSALYSMD